MSSRPMTPTLGAKEFLDRYAPDISICQRDNLEKVVQSAVKKYIDELRAEELHACPATYNSMKVHSKPTTPQIHSANLGQTTRQAQTAGFIYDRANQSDFHHRLPGETCRRSCPVIQCDGPSEPQLNVDGRGSIEGPEKGARNNDWSNWRSSTPFYPDNYSLQLFRHLQNPHKPPPFKDPVNRASRSRPQSAREGRSCEDLTARHPSIRPQSAQSFQRPASADSDRNRFVSGDVCLRDNSGQEYIPELKAWIDSANPSEREVAYNVIKLIEKNQNRTGLEGIIPKRDPMIRTPENQDTVHTTAAYRTRLHPTTPVNVNGKHNSDSVNYFSEATRIDIKRQLASSRQRPNSTTNRGPVVAQRGNWAATSVPPYRSQVKKRSTSACGEPWY